jgi:hypothetical protein
MKTNVSDVVFVKEFVRLKQLKVNQKNLMKLIRKNALNVEVVCFTVDLML